MKLEYLIQEIWTLIQMEEIQVFGSLKVETLLSLSHAFL